MATALKKRRTRKVTGMQRWLVGILLLAASQVFAQPRELKVVTGEAVLDVDKVRQGSEFRLALVARIKEGFHLGAPNPPEGFIATTLTIEAPKGFSVVRLWYPPTKRLKVLGHQLPLYEGRQIFAALLHAKHTASLGKTALTIKLRYQACDDKACYPPRTLTITVPIEVVPPNTPVKSVNEVIFRQLPKDLKGSQPQPEWKSPSTQAFSSDAVTTRSVREAIQRFQVRGLPTVVFIGADGKEREDLRLTGFEPPEAFLKRVQALKGEGKLAPEKGLGALMAVAFKSGRLLLLICVVFVGGLAMNLSPCVFPMVPIVIGYFGRQAEGLLTRRLALGLSFLLGLVVMYGTLGFIAAVTRTSFGSWLQNPWVLAFVTVILLALALSMLGLFEFATPQSAAKGFQVGVQLVGARQFALKLVGAFLMGLLIGVVAAPCVGPAVVALLASAPLLDAPTLFLLFVVLAVGLGLPYLLLAIFIGFAQRLKSGAWNLWVNRALGVLLLGAAIYFAVQTAYAFGWLKSEHPWRPYTLKALEQAKREGKPVIIDFWATWCLACKELEHKTFSDPRVMEALKDVVTLQVDMTSLR